MLIVALASAACATVQSPGGGASVDSSHTRGKELYERKCGTCHELFHPREFDCETWTDNVKRYAARAHLAVADRPAVIAYLHAYAADAK